ncbi:MAG: rhodanese-like domain-containing protein [Pseudomonadota bacterium]|nr:rhodanese-like domain-containing protein [Pseudomonadota bacterium]
MRNVRPVNHDLGRHTADVYTGATNHLTTFNNSHLKQSFLTMILLALLSCIPVHGADQSLTEYVSGFDYAARKAMKTDSEALVKMLAEGKAQLIDIRFSEEYEAWHMGVARSIPLPELPQRLNEIDKSKIIVAACPHKDRAIIAMTYLKTKGYDVKYLQDGLTGLAEYLRGDKARDFIQSLPR